MKININVEIDTKEDQNEIALIMQAITDFKNAVLEAHKDEE
jgi:hypothetical protein